MEISRTTWEEVKAQGFKPEPHTVSFENDGEYWCVKDNGRMVATCCIRAKNTGLQIDELYTLPEYRRRGIMKTLIKFVCNGLYQGKVIHAHCLASSKNIVEQCGFTLKSVVDFKHGTQWRMVRHGSAEPVRR